MTRKRKITIGICCGLGVVLLFIGIALIRPAGNSPIANEAASGMRRQAISTVPTYLVKGDFRSAWAQVVFVSTLKAEFMRENQDKTIDLMIQWKHLSPTVVTMRHNRNEWLMRPENAPRGPGFIVPGEIR